MGAPIPQSQIPVTTQSKEYDEVHHQSVIHESAKYSMALSINHATLVDKVSRHPPPVANASQASYDYLLDFLNL
jgi:hypothetical protein